MASVPPRPPAPPIQPGQSPQAGVAPAPPMPPLIPPQPQMAPPLTPPPQLPSNAENIGALYPVSNTVKKRTVPPPDSEEHKAVVKRAVDKEEYFRNLLTPRFQEIVQYWKTYLGKKDDPRKKDEKWRANVHLPYPYSQIETIVGVVTDLMLSPDPVIQAENLDERDVRGMNQVQKHLNFILDCNHYPTFISNLTRVTGIQGTSIIKIGHTRNAQFVNLHLSPAAREDFIKRVREAELASRTSCPTDPVQFNRWREMVNASSFGVKVPEFPSSSRVEIVRYEGPSFSISPLFDYRFDPWVDDIQKQPIFMQRILKPLDWVKANSGEGKLFNAELVAQLKSGKESRLSEWESEVNEMLGYPKGTEDDPQAADMVELWDCYTPFAEMKHPIIANRETILNNEPYDMPHSHGMLPYTAVRNVSLPGHLMGMSEFAQTHTLFTEADRLRSLRLDAVLLATLPIFVRAAAAGEMPEGFNMLRPGQVIKVPNVQAIAQLVKSDPGLMAAFREIAEIKQDVDEASGTTGNVRGAAATVGRVSATESERRMAQALVRQKERLLRFESDLSDTIPQALLLLYQFSPPEVAVKVGGGNPIITYPRERLIEALHANFRFRGASRTIDRAMVAQQQMTFVQAFAAYLFPEEIREVMRSVWENFGLKGVDQVIKPARTAQMLLVTQMNGQMGLPPPGGGNGQPVSPMLPQGGLAAASALGTAEAQGGVGGTVTGAELYGPDGREIAPPTNQGV